MIKLRRSIYREYSAMRGADISQPSLFITRTVEALEFSGAHTLDEHKPEAGANIHFGQGNPR
jgi:hypothetical protein